MGSESGWVFAADDTSQVEAYRVAIGGARSQRISSDVVTGVRVIFALNVALCAIYRNAPSLGFGKRMGFCGGRRQQGWRVAHFYRKGAYGAL